MTKAELVEMSDAQIFDFIRTWLQGYGDLTRVMNELVRRLRDTGPREKEER